MKSIKFNEFSRLCVGTFHKVYSKVPYTVEGGDISKYTQNMAISSGSVRFESMPKCDATRRSNIQFLINNCLQFTGIFVAKRPISGSCRINERQSSAKPTIYFCI